MNNLPLDPALRDRIHIINVPDYNIEDKVNILNDFFLPKAIGMVGLSSHSVIIPVDVAKYIINKMKVQEKGVRQLQFVVIDLVKKINFLVTNKKKDGTLGFLNVSFYIKNINLPLTLTSNMVDTLFNDSNIDNTSHLLMYN
jgi:ATP-dependent Lon protease